MSRHAAQTGSGRPDRRPQHAAAVADRRSHGPLLARRATSRPEIGVQREQPVRLELAERPPQRLLDDINIVEKRTTVNPKARAAQLPVSAQQEVEPEHVPQPRRQSPLTHKIEICAILLSLPAPAGPPAGSRPPLEDYPAHVLLAARERPEPLITSPENRPGNTTARRRRAAAVDP